MVALKDEKKEVEKRKQEELKNMMLKNIVELGELSLNEEQGRKRLLIEQSTSMIIALSLLITFLGIVLPVVLEAIDSPKTVFIGFACTTLPLLASLVCVILVQWRVKYYVVLNVLDFHKEVKEDPESYSKESDFYEVKIGTIGKMTQSMKVNNDRRVKLIKSSHVLVFVSIFTVLEFSLLMFIEKIK